MKVAILGGTGKLGLALAVRIHRTGHAVTIGSRDLPKAVQAAQSVGEGVAAASNVDAAGWCETAMISVPYRGHRVLLEPLQHALGGKLIVDATVPIDPQNLLDIRTETGKSAAEETAAMIPDAHVFAALQTVSHRVLRQEDVSCDVLVAGGSDGKSDVMALIRSMKLNAIDAGPIEVARHLERLTVLLISINRANKVKESGIKVTGI
jgi:NADPH-dependent F420 reductase